LLSVRRSLSFDWVITAAQRAGKARASTGDTFALDVWEEGGERAAKVNGKVASKESSGSHAQ